MRLLNRPLCRSLHAALLLHPVVMSDTFVLLCVAVYVHFSPQTLRLSFLHLLTVSIALHGVYELYTDR